METQGVIGRPFQRGNTGRPKGAKNKQTVEIREMARRLVNDAAYRRALKKRLQDGELSPPMETLLWHYAYGKPSDKVEVTGAEGGELFNVLRVEVVDSRPAE